MRPRFTAQEAADVLGATPVVSALDGPSLTDLAAASRQRTYGRGQYLWYQGDPGDHLLVVGEGLAEVVLTSERGEEVVLVTLGPRDTAGELALLDGSPRSTSGVAVESTTVLMLPRAAVLEAMAAHPAVLDPTVGRSSASPTGARGRPSCVKRTCARSGCTTGGTHAQARTTTDTYSHVMPALGRDAADRMGSALWD